MDHERLLDDVAAYYALVKAEHPDLSPDELVTLIADRIGLDVELALAAEGRAAGVDEGSTRIQRFVYALEYDDHGEGPSMTTTPSEPTEGAPRPLIDSAAAAEALHMSTQQLQRWAQRGVVTADHVDTDGERWWNLQDLRRQVAAYLDDEKDSS